MITYFTEIVKADNTTINERRLQLAPEHPQYETHIMMRRPVPALVYFVGPTFPRRDKPIDAERYAQNVLLFFKPWRKMTELLMGDGWNIAMQTWLTSLEPTSWVLVMLDNFQSLHEGEDRRKELREENQSVRTNLVFDDRITNDAHNEFPYADIEGSAISFH